MIASLTASCGKVATQSCQDDPCAVNATCDDTGGVVCTCPDGFEGDGLIDGTGCTDVDECAAGLDDCVDAAGGGACADADGGFACACQTGYAGDGVAVSAGGSGCADVDECADGLDDCVDDSVGGVCSNATGSFGCSCRTGFSGDGVQVDAGGSGCALTITGSLTAGDPGQWSDGSVGVSCDAYRNPTPPQTYAGSTGDGYYRIQPAGVAAPFAGYCDMTTDGGGWTLVARLANGWGTSPAAPFFTESLLQSAGGFAANTANATPISPVQNGIHDVSTWADPASIRYLMRETATGTVHNQVTFSSVEAIAHLRQYAAERDTRTGSATGHATAFAADTTYYYASDAEHAWYYWGGIMGRSRDQVAGAWQFGLSVNLPDGVSGYDGIHDDQQRAYLNLGVGRLNYVGYDISGYWPGLCTAACDEWQTTTPGQAVVEVWHR